MMRPARAFYIPLGAAGLTVTALLVLAARAHGKRRKGHWLIDRRVAQ
jgi:hypothetical protein